MSTFPRYVTKKQDPPELAADQAPQDGTKIASAGADKNVKVCDLASQQDMVVGTHDQPVRTVRFFDSGNGPMVVSGSWDKTVKYWDLRQQQPAATLTCQERVYTMDVRDNLCVVGTADRYINVIDLKNPTKFYKTLQSPLKWQTRVVSCFTDSAGFAIGSIEGRCAIQYVEDKDSR
jgi:mRNA export factor